jgi:hypothetical protein
LYILSLTVFAISPLFCQFGLFFFSFYDKSAIIKVRF